MADKHNDPLTGFFDAARDAVPQPDAALHARIMADADAVLKARAPSVPRPSVWRGILAALGGWPTFAGLATATVAGVWIGVSPPDMVAPWIDTQTVEYLPGFDALLEEG